MPGITRLVAIRATPKTPHRTLRIQAIVRDPKLSAPAWSKTMAGTAPCTDGFRNSVSYDGTTLTLRTPIVALVVCGSILAAPPADPTSWENVRRLAPGQPVQVTQ